MSVGNFDGLIPALPRSFCVLRIEKVDWLVVFASIQGGQLGKAHQDTFRDRFYTSVCVFAVRVHVLEVLILFQEYPCPQDFFSAPREFYI